MASWSFIALPCVGLLRSVTVNWTIISVLCWLCTACLNVLSHLIWISVFGIMSLSIGLFQQSSCFYYIGKIIKVSFHSWKCFCWGSGGNTAFSELTHAVRWGCCDSNAVPVTLWLPVRLPYIIVTWRIWRPPFIGKEISLTEFCKPHSILMWGFEIILLVLKFGSNISLGLFSWSIFFKFLQTNLNQGQQS